MIGLSLQDSSQTDIDYDPHDLPRGATGSHELGKRSIRGIFFERLSTMRSVVLNLGKLYLASCPGRDTSASNASLHNAIFRLMQVESFDFDKLARVHTQAEYRMRAMDPADIYIGALGLSGPGGVKCGQWDSGEWT